MIDVRSYKKDSTLFTYHSQVTLDVEVHPVPYTKANSPTKTLNLSHFEKPLLNSAKVPLKASFSLDFSPNVFVVNAVFWDILMFPYKINALLFS